MARFIVRSIISVVITMLLVSITLFILLEVGSAFDRRHQIRNQISPPLVDVLYLGPCRVHPFLQANQAIVDSANDQPDEHDHSQGYRDASDKGLVHVPLSTSSRQNSARAIVHLTLEHQPRSSGTVHWAPA